MTDGNSKAHPVDTGRVSGRTTDGDAASFKNDGGSTMQRLERLDFNLESMLEDFTVGLAQKAYEKGLEMICDIEVDVPLHLIGDPGRLHQIMLNLVGNSLKFTATGEVSIHVTLMSETSDKAILRFAIRDTGIGIPENKIGMLFDKSTRGDASVAHRFDGTGPGLAVSRRLAQLMGGQIGVESEVGKGSEFWFTAQFCKQQKSDAPDPVQQADLQDVRVLIVDDNATSRDTICKRLTSWGMRPVAVSDAPTALRVLHESVASENPFRTALIDIQMPGMDGMQLGRAIRGDADLSDTLLVMLTSPGARGDAQRLEEAGFSDRLTKPLRRQELKDMLLLVLTNREGLTSFRNTIVTCHTAREELYRFAGYRGRILLAEDNITNQELGLVMLEKLGLSADAVADGVEAIEALKRIPYDLVLMDVEMPELDGLEATRRIRDARTGVLDSRIPIIAITAHTMQGDQEKFIAAGMDGHVSKPFSFEDLSKMLGKWLVSEQNNPLEEKKITGTNDQKDNVDIASTAWRIEGMRSRLGDEGIIKKVLMGFLEDIPRQLLVLGEHLKKRDPESAARQAHTIKGASASVGGKALSLAASNLEKAVRDKDMPAVEKLYAVVRIEFEKLKTQMELYLNDNR